MNILRKSQLTVLQVPRVGALKHETERNIKYCEQTASVFYKVEKILSSSFYQNSTFTLSGLQSPPAGIIRVLVLVNSDNGN